MATKVIDAQLLQKAFIAGAYNLERNKDYINELNVFPVPDGDTGSTYDHGGSQRGKCTGEPIDG